MKVIIQTAQTVTIYRSYEVEAPSVSQANLAQARDPIFERKTITIPETVYGSADKDYLVESKRFGEFIECKDEW